MIRLTLLFSSMLALVACEAPPSAPAASFETPTPDPSASTVAVDPIAAQKAVEELESWDAIIEVMHDESLAVEWTIGVKNDGTKRYGLAESVCGELLDRGLVHDSTWVRVVDRQAVISNGGDFQAASLGGVMCATSQWMDP